MEFKQLIKRAVDTRKRYAELEKSVMVVHGVEKS